MSTMGATPTNSSAGLAWISEVSLKFLLLLALALSPASAANGRKSLNVLTHQQNELENEMNKRSKVGDLPIAKPCPSGIVLLGVCHDEYGDPTVSALSDMGLNGQARLKQRLIAEKNAQGLCLSPLYEPDKITALAVIAIDDLWVKCPNGPGWGEGR